MVNRERKPLKTLDLDFMRLPSSGRAFVDVQGQVFVTGDLVLAKDSEVGTFVAVVLSVQESKVEIQISWDKPLY